MSTSPFMTPGQSRNRRALASRRRRRRQAGAVAVIVLVAVVALVAMALANRLLPKRRLDTRARAHAPAAARTLAPALSQEGLALAKPALTLAGLSTPSRNPVHIAFHSPPRAGLLFNLTTGQVLWQRNAFTRLRIASLTKMMTALLTVESAPPDAPVLVTKEAVEADGSKVGVLPLGRHVPLESHALRPAAALRQRRRRRPRRSTWRAPSTLRQAHEPGGREAGDGLHPLLLPLRLLQPRQLLLRRRPRRARPRRPRTAPHRQHRPHLHGRPALPHQGRQALPLQQQPPAHLPLSRASPA